MAAPIIPDDVTTHLGDTVYVYNPTSLLDLIADVRDLQKRVAAFNVKNPTNQI
jgi:hypothetical protein